MHTGLNRRVFMKSKEPCCGNTSLGTLPLKLCYTAWEGVFIMLEYSMLYPQQNEARSFVRLDGMWRFAVDFDLAGHREGWKDKVPGRDWIPVPASFQDFYTDKDIREFCGDVWYQKDVFVPLTMENSRILIRFAAATHRATVYLNGEEVGRHEGGFLPFAVDITESVHLGKDNRLVVCVNNELTETNIPCGMTITKANGRKMNKPYFDFYNYSGLQRSVDLVAVPYDGIFDIDTKCTVEGCDALLGYSITIGGPGQCNLDRLENGKRNLRVTLLDGEGNVIDSSCSRGQGEFRIGNAHLWDLHDPYLYTLKVEILCDGMRQVYDS